MQFRKVGVCTSGKCKLGLQAPRPRVPRSMEKTTREGLARFVQFIDLDQPNPDQPKNRWWAFLTAFANLCIRLFG
jgi:hypothetical protein